MALSVVHKAANTSASSSPAALRGGFRPDPGARLANVSPLTCARQPMLSYRSERPGEPNVVNLPSCAVATAAAQIRRDVQLVSFRIRDPSRAGGAALSRRARTDWTRTGSAPPPGQGDPPESGASGAPPGRARR